MQACPAASPRAHPEGRRTRIHAEHRTTTTRKRQAMKRIQTLIRTAVLGLLVGGASLAHASTQTWTFSSVAFDDGTILSGSFSYDAAVDNVLSYSISVQSGSLPAFTYDMTDSGVYT